jgi:hypothetical protein
MRKVLRLLVAASALFCVAGTASAQVVTFDALDSSYNSTYAPSYPFLGHGDFLVEGDYAIGLASTAAGALPGDLVGAVLDGSDPSSCFSVVCPGNNATNYLALLNDGLPYFSRLDGTVFNLTQFDASFIAASGVNVLDTAMLLRVFGVTEGGGIVLEDVWLPGPVSGDYNFSTYALSATFASTAFVEVDFVGYACTTPELCTRALNQAQFGLDNVSFANPVPEPGTWAMLCVGLVGVGALARRRRAAISA